LAGRCTIVAGLGNLGQHIAFGHRTRPGELAAANENVCHGIISVDKVQWLEAKTRPIGAGDDRAGQPQKDHQQDYPTTTAGTPSAKAKVILQPVEKLVEQEEL
jgi:hypothetical protein